MKMTTKLRAAQPHRLTTRDGITATFGSRLEAEAARIRAGGGQITPAPRKDKK